MIGEKILVSVIIPVHNGARFIEKTCRCILNQYLRDLELILVENHSKDDSLKVCNRIKELDSRVRVLQSFEIGTSFARKKE